MEAEDPVVQTFKDKVALKPLHRRFLLLLVRRERPSLWQVVEDQAEPSIEVEDGRVRPIPCELDAVKDGADLARHGDVDPIGRRVGQDGRRRRGEVGRRRREVRVVHVERIVRVAMLRRDRVAAIPGIRSEPLQAGEGFRARQISKLAEMSGSGEESRTSWYTRTAQSRFDISRLSEFLPGGKAGSSGGILITTYAKCQ